MDDTDAELARVLDVLDRALADPRTAELVAGAPDPTPEQLARLRRLFTSTDDLGEDA